MQTHFIILLVIITLTLGCSTNYDQPVGSEGWLKGGVNEKFETLTEHVGGFGKAMWEVDYRFQELFWAGSDGNWQYAEHQIAELEEVLILGLERRPSRAASAELFLTSAIPGIQTAIGEKDSELFQRRITVMVNTCNSCHVLEDMQFLTVKPPVERRSSIR